MQGVEPPYWPPDSDAYQEDERQLAEIVDELELNESDWHGLLAVSYYLTCSPQFEEAWVSIASMGEKRSLLDDDAFVAIERALIRKQLEDRRRAP